MEPTIRVSLKSEPDCCPRSSLRGQSPLARHTRRRDGDAPALRGRGTCTRLARKKYFCVVPPPPPQGRSVNGCRPPCRAGGVGGPPRSGPLTPAGGGLTTTNNHPARSARKAAPISSLTGVSLCISAQPHANAKLGTAPCKRKIGHSHSRHNALRFAFIAGYKGKRCHSREACYRWPIPAPSALNTKPWSASVRWQARWGTAAPCGF